MKNAEFFEKSHEIGPAIWLLTAYWAMCKVEMWPWFVVDGGEPVADEEFAAHFRVSVYTVARWRKRLMKAGVVEATKRSSARIRQLQKELGVVFKGAYRIRVQRPRLAAALVRTLEAHSQAQRDDEIRLATQMIQ